MTAEDFTRYLDRRPDARTTNPLPSYRQPVAALQV
jgi:hypothetical protein